MVVYSVRITKHTYWKTPFLIMRVVKTYKVLINVTWNMAGLGCHGLWREKTRSRETVKSLGSTAVSGSMSDS